MRVDIVLAAVEPANPDWGKAGPVALFILLLFAVSCFFLFRSMMRRMRRVPASFDDLPDQTDRRAPQGHRGLARPAIPQRTEDDSFAARNDPRPRLGTPDDLLDAAKAKRKKKIQQAKARRG